MAIDTVTRAPRAGHRTMTYDEYLAWVPEGLQAEWVEGEVIIHMPVKDAHQRILAFLVELMRLYVRVFDLGVVRLAPQEVKLWPGGPSREPDLFFVGKAHLERLTPDRMVGPPDLIVEIVSADSVRRDREDKLKEYARAGVPEYWIVDSRPDRRRADFFRLGEDGQYALHATEDDERVESAVLPGLWIEPASLWAVPEPSALQLVARMSPEAASALRRLLDEALASPPDVGAADA